MKYTAVISVTETVVQPKEQSDRHKYNTHSLHIIIILHINKTVFKNYLFLNRFNGLF